jgi:nucleoside 2-deoxyribosyltransferase
MAFYNQFTELKKLLVEAGHSVIAPELEFETKGDDTSVGAFFDRNGGVDAFPPNHDIWKKKGKAITAHFRKIDASDCILVTNYEKKGIPNYIGGNTFLEMGYAYGTSKKIFILNEMPETSAYKEEMLGMQPTILHGSISKIA